jgi:protein required for attachment to host cells
MKSYIVVVADGAKARLYLYARHELEEIADLVNPTQRMRSGEIYAESRPGLKQNQGTGIRAGMDEHRQDHFAEEERRFATEVIETAARAATQHGSRDLVLAAGPEMLGVLRGETDRLHPHITVHELPKNITQEAPRDLRDRLTELGIRT